MVELRATGFRLDRKQYGSPHGRVQLGIVDYQYGDIALIGCALVTTARGGLIVLPPTPNGQAAARREVRILTPQLRADMLRAALAYYIAMGGTEYNQAGDRIVSLGDGSDQA